MANSQVKPYGSWKSPITTQLIVTETIKLGEIVLDGEDIYWSESRPAEGGRNVIVRRRTDGRTEDLTPAPHNVRTRVHEYGGGAFTVSNGIIYFANFDDQRLYRQPMDLPPHPITLDARLRYADIVVDEFRNRLICVREDHTVAGREPTNTIVAIGLTSGDEQQILVSGNDFFAAPRVSPDGSRLAWVSWNHPNLPWDGTELWVGELKPDGSVGESEKVAGGANESIFQPEWSPEGVLFFVSDRTRWWNLYRYGQKNVEPICPRVHEFGRPQWLFSMSTYGFVSPDRIICTYTSQGIWHLAELECTTGELDVIDTSYTEVWNLRASSEQAVFCAGSPTQPSSIVRFDLAGKGFDVL
jgi:hypothetical protein